MLVVADVAMVAKCAFHVGCVGPWQRDPVGRAGRFLIIMTCGAALTALTIDHCGWTTAVTLVVAWVTHY